MSIRLAIDLTPEETNQMQNDPDRQQFNQMMEQRPVNSDTLNEKIRLYFKKGEIDWDRFDDILVQLTMLAMQNTEKYKQSLSNYLEEEIDELD